MKRLILLVATITLLVPSARAADNTALDGYGLGKSDASIKLGWVSGYTKAMAFAGTIQMRVCTTIWSPQLGIQRLPKPSNRSM